uniref:Alcohol dehydrogenase n=1 Tax=uncultured prokaryote TaxID=198431 RepID=H5SPX4_9ZZZZ|nr:alcohol dehydrogenase [uncultured prokaryote]
MKALLLEKPSPVENAPLKFCETDAPLPGKNEIRLKVSSCGVCHTDLHIVEGEIIPPSYPVIPGHQIVGVIDEVGEGVKKFKKGERVGVGWLNRTCGKCEFCLKKLENLCESAQFTGYHINGGYGEYAVVHEDFAFSLPPELDDAHAAPLLCAGIIGYRAFKMCGAKEGENLGLFGFGASAHIVCQVAYKMGINAIVFTRSKKHRELALKLGARWAGSYDDRPPFTLDAGIIFAPAGEVVPFALNLLKPGGSIAINAIYMTELPPMKYELIYRERKIMSIANYTREDAKEFLEVAGKMGIITSVEQFHFQDANRALQLLKESKINGSAVLVWS